MRSRYYRPRSRRRTGLWLGIGGGAAALCALAVAYFAAGGGTSAEDSLQRAREAWQSRDYSLAAEEYERYLKTNPNGDTSAEVKLQLANIYFLNLKQYDRARSYYTEFLNQAPSHQSAPAARERLAEVLAETGRSYEAIAEYENLNPQNETERRRVRLRIADLYYDWKNYSQALTEYEKVTAGVPYDELSEQAHMREAAIYHLARGQYEQALPVYEKIASQTADPDSRRRALLGMSDCYAGLYKFDEAIKLLREVKDPAQQDYIARRIGELEQQKRDLGRAPQIRWTPKRKVEEAQKR